ncbi:MAG: V-type ATP synthase subunit A [Gammaproteobacteria bacterium]|jgi:V/A-type H+-transporting ATPase subunit A
MAENEATARVVAVQDDLVTIAQVAAGGRLTPLIKNEVIYICPPNTPGTGNGVQRLKAEVLRIRGHTADAQVFENTAGIGVGDPVVQTGELLSVTLGPGILGQVYDGLQNPLERIALTHGYFLTRGAGFDALDRRKRWSFVPSVQAGARLCAGAVIGTVQEGRFTHRIMLPFDQPSEVEVTWIQEGAFPVDVPVARVRDASGEEHSLTMMMRWPVRQPLPNQLLRHHRCERLYPTEPLLTTLRLIDTFFPIARGGTGCIPGPFGAGKTVLQNLIARFAAVDIVIVVACGERAGEVVETITEFPKLTDPRGGGALMDRTVIICNTSSMPVAAREASIYTGITLGEYYRQMGYDVLLLADSTSRWAQAMRETSNRMEEIPGEEAFPAYLDSTIRSVYERAGVIRAGTDRTGSLTLIGTVSPAGGNFEEPVTQSTLATVKTFLGLSAERAYRRSYPAVDPLLSWSRYVEQLAPWYEQEMGSGWTRRVEEMLELLRQGDEILQMMQVTGEEGVSLDDFITYQKSLLLDRVYLQQDAFDEVDVSTPIERQRQLFVKVYSLVKRTYRFADKEAARDYFTELTSVFRNLNYTSGGSPDYALLLQHIDDLIEAVPATAG